MITRTHAHMEMHAHTRYRYLDVAVHGLGIQNLLECQFYFDNRTTAEAAAANAEPHAWHVHRTFWTGPDATQV